MRDPAREQDGALLRVLEDELLLTPGNDRDRVGRSLGGSGSAVRADHQVGDQLAEALRVLEG